MLNSTEGSFFKHALRIQEIPLFSTNVQTLIK